MSPLTTWPEHFGNRLADWLCSPVGTDNRPPRCPFADGGAMVEHQAAIGQPVRIEFACGHVLHSPDAGLTVPWGRPLTPESYPS